MMSKMSGFIKFGNASFRDFCSNKCVMCINIFKWVPVVFIAAILGWSYYAFVLQLCFYTVDDIFKTVIYLLFYHFLLVMFSWAYWLTIFTEIGRVPPEFKISKEDAERLEKEVMNPEVQEQILEKYAKDLPVLMRSMTGGYRYCNHCHHIKPDRAHHCSVCKTCLLKMDHHCPWVNNCVSFTNYKFFLLFLLYGLLYCLFIAASTLEYFILFWRVRLNQNQLPEGGKFHILFLFMVAIMFALSLGFLSGYHLYLVLLNRSTLESFRAPIFRLGPDKNGFSLGKMANFQQIFGEDWRFWLVPISTSLGTGVTYPTRTQGNSYHSMGVTNSAQQASINSQGEVGATNFPQISVEEDKSGLLKENSVPINSTDTSEDDSSPYNKGDMSEMSYKMANMNNRALS